jgi:hypothetical protein
MGLESFNAMSDDLESQVVRFGWIRALLLVESSHARKNRQYQSVKIR